MPVIESQSNKPSNLLHIPQCRVILHSCDPVGIGTNSLRGEQVAQILDFLTNEVAISTPNISVRLLVTEPGFVDLALLRFETNWSTTNAWKLVGGTFSLEVHS